MEHRERRDDNDQGERDTVTARDRGQARAQAARSCALVQPVLTAPARQQKPTDDDKRGLYGTIDIDTGRRSAVVLFARSQRPHGPVRGRDQVAGKRVDEVALGLVACG
ncbi:hypothetical protein HNP84_005786 [Thermocatellispora tengchongensis]|uniref:Uncharacterized protein n=1 Tax=Thermocatellispora tengchongensis TaxID=1073253 RepID=A0A840P9T4_9ACTN|nr:hypothetical protein [Thermocatellispora tengchongensis]MBB5136042.1 hypothetical protein [Thermocatellispora tengchongensis]